MRFASAMTARTDAELIEVVTDPAGEWEPEAIEAAKAEIEKRGLRYEPRAASSASTPPEDDASRAGPGLERNEALKAFLLGLCFVALGVFVAHTMTVDWKRKGKRRKREEFMQMAILGAVISFVFGIAIRAAVH